MLTIEMPVGHRFEILVELMRLKKPLFPSVATLQTGLNTVALDSAIAQHCSNVQHLIMCIDLPKQNDFVDSGDNENSDMSTDSSRAVIANGPFRSASDKADRDDHANDVGSASSEESEAANDEDEVAQLVREFEARMSVVPALQSLHIKSWDLPVNRGLMKGESKCRSQIVRH